MKVIDYNINNLKPWLDYSKYVISFTITVFFKRNWSQYYNYVGLVINYVNDYFCNQLLYSSADGDIL